MDLEQATTLEIHRMTERQAEQAVHAIGAEKLRIRQQMEWRRILLAWEVGIKARGDGEQWRKLNELNKRLAELLAHLFRAAGHRW